jgi:hypothetical protein
MVHPFIPQLHVGASFVVRSTSNVEGNKGFIIRLIERFQHFLLCEPDDILYDV